VKKNDDRKYIGELIDHIEENFCIDKRREYVVGLGGGGGLAHLLACDPVMSTRIAAFTIASGSIWTEKAMKQKKAVREPLYNADRCKPGRTPIPILDFHGGEDQLIAYNGASWDGPTVPVPEWLDQWRERNGCARGNKTTMLYDGRVTKYDWNCGKSIRPVLQHYLLHTVGHTWPTTTLLREEEQTEDTMTTMNEPDNYFDGTPIILNFFKFYELPAEFVRPNKLIEPLPEVKDEHEITHIKDDVDEPEPSIAETVEGSNTKASEKADKVEEKIKDEL
jgi:poly(3-hydroxybutyrate) depolymerase